MVHEISQLSRSTSNVDLNTHSAMNEAMELEYIHQMQELWYQSSRAVHKLGSIWMSEVQQYHIQRIITSELHITRNNSILLSVNLIIFIIVIITIFIS